MPGPAQLRKMLHGPSTPLSAGVPQQPKASRLTCQSADESPRPRGAGATGRQGKRVCGEGLCPRLRPWFSWWKQGGRGLNTKPLRGAQTGLVRQPPTDSSWEPGGWRMRPCC